MRDGLSGLARKLQAAIDLQPKAIEVHVTAWHANAERPVSRFDLTTDEAERLVKWLREQTGEVLP